MRLYNFQFQNGSEHGMSERVQMRMEGRKFVSTAAQRRHRFAQLNELQSKNETCTTAHIRIHPSRVGYYLVELSKPIWNKDNKKIGSLVETESVDCSTHPQNAQLHQFILWKRTTSAATAAGCASIEIHVYIRIQTKNILHTRARTHTPIRTRALWTRLCEYGWYWQWNIQSSFLSHSPAANSFTHLLIQ